MINEERQGYLAGQTVMVYAPELGIDGRCAVVDDHGDDTISVLTLYQPRGGRRFVKGVPLKGVSHAGPRPYHGQHGDGEAQGASGAIERVTGRIVANGKRIGKPIAPDAARERAVEVASRHHDKRPSRRDKARERQG